MTTTTAPTLDSLVQTLTNLAEQYFAVWTEVKRSNAGGDILVEDLANFLVAHEDFEHFIPDGCKEPLYALVCGLSDGLPNEAELVARNRLLLEETWKDSPWRTQELPQTPENQWLLLDVFLKTSLESWFYPRYRAWLAE